MLLLTLACAPRAQRTPPPAAASAPVVALSGASMMIGVGDIHACDAQSNIRSAFLGVGGRIGDQGGGKCH